jgi:two-component system phosphate regulon sensor histidine kinase PhoR
MTLCFRIFAEHFGFGKEGWRMSKRGKASSHNVDPRAPVLPQNHPEQTCSEEVDLALYKSIIDSVPMAVVTVDSTFRITQFNHWAENITGYSAKSTIGRHCREILQSALCASSCPLRAVIDRLSSTITDKTTIRNRVGDIVPVRFSAAALFDPAGKLIGGVEAFADISKMVAMERERTNFISMLAHDMRSSLTGIHGLGLRLLRLHDDANPETARKHIEIITREAAKLESMIDEFIEYSRIESGMLKLNFAATSLDKELEEIYEVYRIKATQRGMKLELQIDDILPLIEADAIRLRRVFTNLLDNAIKFSKEHGTVAIAAREKGQEVVITITDDGIGIHPDDLPHIFDVFHRGRETAGRQGHGLGLATVKAIVEGHGGRILVSTQVNTGSTFAIFLPKKGAVVAG